MVIALNPEQEQVVGQAIAAGLIERAEDAAELGVRTIRQRLDAEHDRVKPLSLSHAERLERLRAFVDRVRPEAPPLSDEAVSRDSIYGERGL
jgi:hypothetical protein